MLKNVGAETHNPFSWTSFGRTSWTRPEGLREAIVFEARVFNVNLVNWTVDLSSVHDQRTLLDVQVGTPYMHPLSGEGLYCVPEVGAKCLVCIPSDGPPPYVLCFVMPMEQLPAGATEDASVEDPQAAKGFTYGGGRARGKPGDIIARGRDGNFMILHRGGVAQFGSGPLAQRICVPLRNLVTDISQTYEHFNAGGTVNWGIQDRGSADPDAFHVLTQRVYANDEFADIRVATGHVRVPVPEPVGDAGETSNLEQLGIGTGKKDTVFEFTLARGGFDGQTGEFAGAPEDVKVRIFFDREGGVSFRAEGSVNFRVKKNLRITVDGNTEIFCKGNATVQADGVASFVGKAGVALGTEGATAVINSGTKPVAHVGSSVRVSIALPITMMAIVPPTPTPQPVQIISGTLEGFVMTGIPSTLV